MAAQRQIVMLIYTVAFMVRAPFWQLWRLTWQFRPLVWLAFFAATGTAAGLHLSLVATQHASTPLVRSLTPFLVALFLSGALLMCARWEKKYRRLCFGLGVFCAMCGYASWRVLPPTQDVSLLTRIHAPVGQLLKTPLVVRGYIADAPRRSEGSTHLPLQCVEADVKGLRRAAAGRINLALPPMPALQKQLGCELRIGDAIQVETELAPLALPTNVGERNASLNPILDGIWLEGKVGAPISVRLLRTPPLFSLSRRIADWRRALLLHYENAFNQLNVPYPHASAQLLTAMAFGEGGLNEPLPRRLRDDFRAAGMSHILVASGTQVAFLCLLLLGASRVLGMRRWILLVFLIPILLVYALIAGGPPSIWRATIAGICFALAFLLGRESDALSLWSLALIVLLLINPMQLFDIGFQLSFGAAWGLIVVGPPLYRLFENRFGRSAFCGLAAFSLAAQAGVAPLLAYHFGQFSLAGLGANLLGVPLAGVLVASSLADLVLPLNWLHHANYVLATTIANLAGFAARLPGANVERPPLRLMWTVALYGLLLLALMLRPRSAVSWRSVRDDLWRPLCYETGTWWRRQRFRAPAFLVGLVLLLLSGLAWRIWCERSTRHLPLRLTMFDVGQGESLLVRSPSGRTVLIDGGSTSRFESENVGNTVIVPYLQAMGVRRLDALVITHSDADHCNGLLAVVREIPVGMVIDGGQPNEAGASEYLELRRALELRKIPVVAAHSGQRLNLGADAELQVLAPLTPPFRGENADNNNAATLRLSYGQTSILLTGDIERAAEERLVRRGAQLQCTVLKVAHHGSKTSTSELLLRAAAPRAALISCGRYNSFGHPSATVLQRLARHHISTFRTDISGALEVACDGQTCSVQTQR